MAAQVFLISIRGGMGALSELVGVLALRRADVRSLTTWREADDSFRIQLAVDIADGSAIDLLHNQLNRIVNVLEIVQQPVDNLRSPQGLAWSGHG